MLVRLPFNDCPLLFPLTTGTWKMGELFLLGPGVDCSLWLNLMILKVFFNLNYSMIMLPQVSSSWESTAGNPMWRVLLLLLHFRSHDVHLIAYQQQELELPSHCLSLFLASYKLMIQSLPCRLTLTSGKCFLNNLEKSHDEIPRCFICKEITAKAKKNQHDSISLKYEEHPFFNSNLFYSSINFCCVQYLHIFSAQFRCIMHQLG